MREMDKQDLEVVMKIKQGGMRIGGKEKFRSTWSLSQKGSSPSKLKAELIRQEWQQQEPRLTGLHWTCVRKRSFLCGHNTGV